jgi:hypothetical protein
MIRAYAFAIAPLALVAACTSDSKIDPDFPEGYPAGTLGSTGKADRSTITKIPYRGGIVLHQPTEVHVYWGDYWSTQYGQHARDVFDGFAQDAGSSSWYAHLSEYPDGSGPPGAVVAATPLVVDDASLEPGPTVSDRAIRGFLQTLFADGRLAYDAQAVYVVFTPPSTTVSTPWGKSCAQLCGYHYHFPGTTGGTAKSDILYAVIPHLSCGGCAPPRAHANGDTIDAMTATLAHEVAEAVTDPNCDAWTTSHGLNEVGDLCDTGTVATWNGTPYVVQDVWSNAAKRCVH